MIKGGKALHKSKAENPWGYLSEVLKKELPNYFAELNIKEHDKFKEEKSTLSFKDILEGGKGKI